MDYTIDPTFSNFSRLFVLSFKNVDNVWWVLHTSNALIDNRLLFDEPVKNKKEACEKLIEMSRKSDHTTGNFLYYSYHQNYYKPIGLDLSREVNTTIPQKISFTRKLEENDGATMFLSLKCIK